MPVSVKIGGVWKTATAVFNKVGGVWKTAADMPVKIAGVWKTGILAPPGAFESIATISGTGVSTITFSSIPSTYKSLQIRAIARNSSDGGTSAAGYKIRFNGTSTSDYRSHYIESNGSAVSASSNLDNGIFAYRAVARSASTASSFGTSIVDIIDYASTSKLKTVRAISGADFNNTNGRVDLSSGLYTLNANAISSITIVNELNDTWAAGTTFALYGIK